MTSEIFCCSIFNESYAIILSLSLKYLHIFLLGLVVLTQKSDNTTFWVIIYCGNRWIKGGREWETGVLEEKINC